MSGPTVSKALQARFDAIRRSELERLKKKLGGLNDEDRRSVEAITADIIQAIARVPVHALSDDAQPPTLEAVVRLFALESSEAASLAARQGRQPCPPPPASCANALTKTNGTYSWIVYAMAMVDRRRARRLCADGDRRPIRRVRSRRQPVATPSGQTGGAVVDEQTLQAYRDILARDPKNLPAAARAPATSSMTRGAMATRFLSTSRRSRSTRRTSTSAPISAPRSGIRAMPDAAVAQYRRSLQINPTHAQTLFNLGVVEADGRHDYAAAAAAWDTLLASNPDYPNAASSATMLASAQSKAAPAGH